MSARNVAEKMKRRRRSRETHRAAMWAALSMALGAVIVIILLGRAPELLGVVAGALLLACLGICVWAAVAETRGARAVDRALRELRRSRSGWNEAELTQIRNMGTEGGM